MQKDHPKADSEKPAELEIIGRFLLGLANFFELLANELIRFGLYLIELATRIEPRAEEDVQ